MKPVAAERSSVDLIPSLRQAAEDAHAFARGSNPAHFKAHFDADFEACGPSARPTLRIEASELIRLLEIDNAQAVERESRRRIAIEIPSLAHARSVRCYDFDAEADDRLSETVVEDDFPEITMGTVST